MWNFNLLAATRTVEATMPFMLYRMAVCLGVALASLLSALAGTGTLIAFASFSTKPGSVASLGATLGLGALGFILYRYRAGLFFNIQAGHLALLAELARGEKLPHGKQQIELARQTAAQRFPTAAGFLEIGEAIKQVLQVTPSLRCAFLSRLKDKPLATMIDYLAGRLARTGSQSLLALCFIEKEANPWQSVRTGLVLHLRHFDFLSKNRLYLLGFEYLGLLVAYLAMLYPVDSAIALLPVDVGAWRHVFALIFAWSLKAAFLEPIATTALAELYFNLAKPEVEVDEEEIKELEASSEAFRQILERTA